MAQSEAKKKGEPFFIVSPQLQSLSATAVMALLCPL
jgi:hypothetical protein